MPSPRPPATIQPRWQGTELLLLWDHYPLMSAAALSDLIFRRTGRRRTANAVRARADADGLDYRQARGFGLMSFRRTAKETNVSINIIRQLVTKGTLAAIGKGKARFLTRQSVEKLHALCPPPPVRSIGCTAMRDRLGYSETHALRLLNTGAIPAVKRSGRWYVDLDAVEAIEREMRASGEARRWLPGTPGMSEERRKCCEYGRERRARERAARDEERVAA